MFLNPRRALLIKSVLSGRFIKYAGCSQISEQDADIFNVPHQGTHLILRLIVLMASSRKPFFYYAACTVNFRTGPPAPLILTLSHEADRNVSRAGNTEEQNLAFRRNFGQIEWKFRGRERYSLLKTERRQAEQTLKKQVRVSP
jgi:hypothetical protein